MIRTKEKSLSTLISECDDVFSEMVRLEDANNGYQTAGYITCITCGAIIPWRQADAAHVFLRSNMGTRFDGLNAWSACQNCNRHDPDHQDKIKAKVNKILGDFEFNAMQQRSRSMMKFTRFDLVEMIERFKIKVKELKKHL